MMKRFYIGIVFAMLFSIPVANVYGQVEHNYHVVSGFTDCDSLHLDHLEKDQAVSILRQTRFRYQQEFKLTRNQGLKHGAYYSCDGKKGYLVITFNDQDYLYFNVPLDIWEEFTKSPDPEGYFLNHIRDAL